MDKKAITESIHNWDKYYLDFAKKVATKSKDNSTKVGAIIVDSKFRPVSFGYNGFARGVDDTPERLNNRELKYKMIVHAELNAALFAKRDLDDCTLYTYPFMPCSNCAAAMINAGITRCVSYENANPRWIESFKLTQQMFKEAGVILDLYPTDVTQELTARLDMQDGIIINHADVKGSQLPCDLL